MHAFGQEMWRIARSGPAGCDKQPVAAQHAEDILGLDLGSGSLKVALVRDGLPITTDSQSLPPTVFERGHLKNPDQLTAAVKALWKRTRLPIKKVRISLPDPQIQVRSISIPDLGDDAEIRDALALNYSGQFDGLQLTECGYDFRITSREQRRLELSVLATPKSTLQPIVAALKKAGLEVVSIESPGSALARAIETPADGAPVLVVLVDGDVTHLVLSENGTAVFARSFPFGASDFRAPLIDAGRTPQEADTLSREIGLESSRRYADQENIDVQNSLLGVFDRFVGQLDDAIDVVRALGRRPAEHLVVMGDGARIRGLPAAIASYLPSAGALMELRLSESFSAVSEPARYATALALSAGNGPNLLLVPKKPSRSRSAAAVREIDEAAGVSKRRISGTRSIPKPYLITMAICTLAFAAMSLLGGPIGSSAEEKLARANELELAQAGGAPVAADSKLDGALAERRGVPVALKAALAAEGIQSIELEDRGLLLQVSGDPARAAAAITAAGSRAEVVDARNILIRSGGAR